MVTDAQIAEIIRRSADLDQAGRSLIAAANTAGGRDNITVVLFRVESVDGPGHSPPVAAQPAAAARLPRAPREDGAASGRRRGRWLGGLKVTAILLAFAAIVASGAWIASRSVYFVGTSDEGFVTLYQGLPYELGEGMALYHKQYESGVSISTLPPAVRRTVLAHELRSHDDATDLVRQLEEGRVAGQQ
jgi:protein phosphatase